jgi:hypothetical protein
MCVTHVLITITKEDTHGGAAAKLRALLQQQGVDLDINAGDQRRFTAFHCACAAGHVECVRALLAAGCDTTLRNDVGLSGWELAHELHRASVLTLCPDSALRQRIQTQPRDKKKGGGATGQKQRCVQMLVRKFLRQDEARASS